MGGYLLDIWKCRFFWMSLVKMDLRTRYRRSVLGLGWSLLNPIAMTAVLCAVFCPIMNIPPEQHGPFLLISLATWQFLTTSVIAGCQSFFVNESYIRQHPLPLAIYPLRTVLGSTFHFLIALSLVVGFVWLWAAPAEGATLGAAGTVLALVPALALLFLLAWSLAVLGGLANVFFQDTQHIADVALQMLFYLTPIIYRKDLLAGRTGYAWLIDFNPVVWFLDVVRLPVLEGRLPAWDVYLKAGLTAAAVGAVAAGLVGRFQKKLIFHL